MPQQHAVVEDAIQPHNLGVPISPVGGNPNRGIVMTLREWIAEYNSAALTADGFEDAIIGIGERCSQPILVVYDIARCIEILMARDGMSYDDAFEFFEFNTLGAWMGEMTPLFVWCKPDWLSDHTP